MKCPECGAATDVIDSRPQDVVVKRRRQCFNGHRFTTTELAGDPRLITAAIEMMRAAFP